MPSKPFYCSLLWDKVRTSDPNTTNPPICGAANYYAYINQYMSCQTTHSLLAILHMLRLPHLSRPILIHALPWSGIFFPNWLITSPQFRHHDKKPFLNYLLPCPICHSHLYYYIIPADALLQTVYCSGCATQLGVTRVLMKGLLRQETLCI